MTYASRQTGSPFLPLMENEDRVNNEPAVARKRVAFSFDDVPHDPGAFFTPDERTALLIERLAQEHIDQAAFFVIVGDFQEPRGRGGEGRVRAYTEAGHVLGSHSYSHPRLSETSVEDFIADIDRAAEWFTGREGKRPWFRFPFLDEGDLDPSKRSAVRAALKNSGYANAYVTVLTLDWYLDSLLAQAVHDHRDFDIAAVRDLYVESLLEPAEFYDQLAVEALGRSPVHVILLHENDLNTLFIADAARAFRSAGWDIVPMDEAYQDPIASIEPDGWCGSGRVAALALDSGKIRPFGIECKILEPETMLQAFERRVFRK
ncbi:polysaccharide deacetylase family protein [Streptomyces sp. NPDC088725]|uniref:polysaccharide deacetylase family protein n=1 Tax=Streptomyces sp. NPDC088725 TaxID=3365873 RepID=UPI0038051C42